MSDLIIRGKLAEKLRERARRENRTVEEILERLLAPVSPGNSIPANREAVEFARLSFRQKLYHIARDYWRRVDDQERLILTDNDLDEQFWLIDSQGVPRLKSDQGQMQLSSDPLEGLIGFLDEATDATDLSTSVRETLAQNTHPDYGWTVKKPDDDDVT